MLSKTLGRSTIRGVATALLLSLIALLIILRLTKGHEFLPDLFRIKPYALAWATGLVALGWVLDAVRLMVLVLALGGRLGFWRAMKICLIGAFVSGVTPFDTGGEPLQIYLLHLEGMSPGTSTAIITLKSLLSSFARLCLSLVIPLWLIIIKRSLELPRSLDVVLTCGLGLYVFLFVLVAFFIMRPEVALRFLEFTLYNRIAARIISKRTASSIIDRIRTEISEFRGALDRFRYEKRHAVGTVTLLSFVGWLLVFSIPIVILRGFGIDPPYAEALGFASLLYVASSYVPTPGASGAAEAGLAVLFSQMVPLHLLGIFVLAWRIFTYYLTLIAGGLLAVLGLTARRPQRRRRGNRGSQQQ